MARSNVPKFGNWENGDNVPYTVYFDKARKTRDGKMINPNDPEQNPEILGNPPKLKARPEEPIGRGAVRPATQEHRSSREYGDFRQLGNSRGRNENMGEKASNERSYGSPGQRPALSARPSAGSDQSFDRSPLHPHYQAKVMGRGSGSPAWEGRSYDSSHGTPGRSRMRPARGDESEMADVMLSNAVSHRKSLQARKPEKSAAVPRFGEWNENDPQSAENFTHIFNKVREERNTAATVTPKHPSHTCSQPSEEPKKGCFCWW